MTDKTEEDKIDFEVVRKIWPDCMNLVQNLRQENAELRAEVDQLRVKLAGCAVAAQGHIDPENLVKEGQYG